jgi:FMN-dependent oxidoreductase (nitrilotriacetate monooxygenase family)
MAGNIDMRANAFHLSWFLQGSSIQAWGAPWTGNIVQDWMSADVMLDLARSIDRACFDYMLVEDSIFIGETFGNSRDFFLEKGMSVPRQEPGMVATLMAGVTKHVGLVPTLSTFSYAPYLVARMISTLDQLSGGRAGWNMVTGSSNLSAQNFGAEKLPPHDQRYDMAEEFVEIVRQLWTSWEPGAIVGDEERSVLIDPAKVHTIDYKGKYYSSRGPLNSGPSPQGRPVIAQAGGSDQGKQFATKFADTIVSQPKGVARMKDYRADITRRAIAEGRDPKSIKVFYLVAPILAETQEEADLKVRQRTASAAKNLDLQLARLGRITSIDFSKFDLDAPVADLKTQSHQSSLNEFLVFAGKRTLREAMTDFSTSGMSVDLVGTPDKVASQMQDVMEEVGGDGFLFSLPNVSRRTIAEVCDGLVPVLQKRGLVRKAYEHKHLRDNLLAF